MMRLLLCVFCVYGVYVAAEEREKRQAKYHFPGPRNEINQGDTKLYSVPQHQLQAHLAQAYSPPRDISRSQAPGGRKHLDENGRYDDEEEGPTTPDPLSLLLADSKFACSGKKDGYYADDSVNCRVFHYCVGGDRHSWMCPTGTVFHQVHLNCVPSNQDICDRSEKFHIVNDYLYKPLDFKGPNKTARYYQRYYPKEFLLGPPTPTQFGFPPFSPSNSPGGVSDAKPASQTIVYGGDSSSRPAPQPQSEIYGGGPSPRPASQSKIYGGGSSHRPASQPHIYGGGPSQRPAAQPDVYNGGPSHRPAAQPGVYGGGPLPRPAPQLDVYSGGPSPRLIPNSNVYVGDLRSRPALQPTSYGGDTEPTLVASPISHGGAPASSPVPTPSSYGDDPASTPNFFSGIPASQPQPQFVAILPQQSLRPRSRTRYIPPSRQASVYLSLPELPHLPEIPSIHQVQLSPQRDDDPGPRIPNRYNPIAYRHSLGPQPPSRNDDSARVRYDDKYN
ncbi:uncharacterized protein LOC143256997 [Tachypleus tridentatus]|uniref:uncharacterized protein LOC143256997 n=1 Tax=Tachypleus tridentatus TaxID=6853 RepID=UPI003FCF809A